MNLDDFLAAKREMEAGIRDAIVKHVTDFEEKTGFTPSSIDVRIYRRDILGKKCPVFTVGEVSTDVPLEA